MTDAATLEYAAGATLGTGATTVQSGAALAVGRSGGGFAGANVSLADDSPKWARGVSVNGDGNIVLTVKPKGFILSFR